MPISQLRASDLRAGDVLLKFNDGTNVSRLIKFCQGRAGQLNTHVTHAGLMFDNSYVIEAQRVGLNANDIRVQNARLGYLVFRPENAQLGQGAATFSKVVLDSHHAHGNMKYTVPGAFGSLTGPGARPASSRDQLDARLNRILSGKSHPFFCSQFVVMTYQFAGEQNGIPAGSLFPFPDSKVSPSVLASHLSGSHHFQEIGYLLPGER
jgi:hypothetical protein